MSSFDNLLKPLCIYLSRFLDMKTIGLLSRLNKHWNKSLENNQV